MANRAITIFQTIEDVLDILGAAEATSSHRILCLSSQPEEVCPRILTSLEDLAERSFLLCREDLIPYIECFVDRRDCFIDVSESPAILVETSHLKNNELSLGRYWFRTLKLLQDQGQLTSVRKNSEFVQWADLVFSIVRRRAKKIKVSDRVSVYALAQAERMIAANAGTFDAQNNFIMQIPNAKLQDHNAGPQ